MSWGKKAEEGDILSSDTAEIGMICEDLVDGGEVVIDRLIDHKYAEVGCSCNGSFSYDGDRMRFDEMRYTGRRYQPPGMQP